MRNGIKEALLRVTVIVDHAETGCSQEVYGHDRAGEKFHLGALPSAAQLYHAFETRWTDQENARRSGAPVPISNRDVSRFAECKRFPPHVGELPSRERIVRHAELLPSNAAAPQWEPRKPLGES